MRVKEIKSHRRTAKAKII